jgi:hypothetical protein
MSKLGAAANAAETAGEYRYLKCVERWNPFERKRTGCGKYFTADSVLSECPECGNALSFVRRGEPVRERIPRVVMEKCAKCANNVGAMPCSGGGRPANPEYCVPCKCRACCAESAALYKRFLDGEVTLSRLVADNIREREAKERGAEAAEEKPGPMAAVLGKIFEDEIPF